MKKILITALFYLCFFFVALANALYFLFYFGWKCLLQLLLNEYRRFISVLPQWVRYAIMKPDLFGLYHNFKYLDTINHQVKVWPIEKQVLYADVITRKQVTNKTLNINECIEQLRQFKVEPELLKHVNAMSIGNIAYIATYCEDKTLAVIAHKTLSKIRGAFVG